MHIKWKVKRYTHSLRIFAFLPQVKKGKLNKCSKFTSYAMNGHNWLMEVC